MATPNQKTWKIDRIQLVYFDALRLQWQLFHFHHNIPQSPHRRYIRQLLASVEDLLRNSVGGSRVILSSTVNDPPPLPINIDKISGTITDLCKYHPVAWERLIDKLKELSVDENLAADVCEIIDQISDLIKSAAGFKIARKIDYVEMGSQQVLDLLSILPVRRHWETFGLWAGYYDKSKHAIRDRRSSYMYVSKGSYKPDVTENKRRRSSELLGYEVNIDVLKTSLDRITSAPERTGAIDYFEYCWDLLDWEIIKKNKWNESAFYGQKELFLFYAFFIDALLWSEEDPFVISYPLTTLGRTHFLRIYLSRVNKKDDNSGIVSLWLDWQKVHEKIDWPEAKVCLAQDIEQIDLARFQALVNTKWPKQHRKYIELPKNIYKRSICHYAPLLFYIDRVSYANGEWGYDYDSINIGRDVISAGDKEISEITISHRWKIGPPPPPPRKYRKDIWEAGIMVRRRNLDRALGSLHKGRRRMLLRQQIDLSKDLNESFENQRRIERESRKLEIQRLIKWSSREEMDNLRGLREKVDSLSDLTEQSEEELALKIGIALNNSSALLTLGDLLAPWCKVNHDGKIDLTAAKMEFRRLISPTFTEALSRYFGMGIVKSITHAGDYFDGTYQEMFEDAADSYQAFNDALNDGNDYNPPYQTGAVEAFHSSVSRLLLKLINDRGGERTPQERNDLFQHLGFRDLSEKRTNEFTFSLSWKKGGREVRGIYHKEDPNQIPKIANKYETIQLHCAIHKIFNAGFRCIFRKLHKFDARIVDHLAFSKRLYPHSSKQYMNTAWLCGNYLTLKIFGSKSNPEKFSKGEVEFIDLFHKAGIRKYGHLYIALGRGDGATVIFDHSLTGPPVIVKEETVFPFPLDDEVKGRVFLLKPREISIILAFYSWRAEPRWATLS